MERPKNTILEKIDILVISCKQAAIKENPDEIMKIFTDASIKILDGEFGFAWLKGTDNKYKLSYKSANTPFYPTPTDKLLGSMTIEIKYGQNIYGNIVVVLKKKRDITEEQIALSHIIGSVAAQALTIPWVMINEKRSISLAEKQKEIETLLSQEKIKREFIESATHELRTPLAIIQGNVDLALLEQENSESTKKTLRAINSEIKNLSEILHSLTLIITLEKSSKEDISLKPINISEFIENIAARLKLLAKKKKIEISVKNEGNINFIVSGDKTYLDKLFLNLIKNAITYGRKNGHIEIRLYREMNMLKIEIVDDGIGIPEESLSRIFERFYRVDKAHSAIGKHSGLGLSIAKWAAQIHGGTIDAKSTYKKGSTFTVTLPLLQTN